MTMIGTQATAADAPAAVAPQAPAVVSPAEPASQIPKDPELDWVKRFNQLSKRDKEILEQKKSIKEQMEAVERFNTMKKSAKENPLAYLQEAGLTLQEITEYVLNDNKMTPDQRIAALEAKLAQKDSDSVREREEKEAAEAEHVKKQYREGIAKFVGSSEEYEFIKLHEGDGVDLVFEVAHTMWEETGEIPNLELACGQVESYLEKRVENLIKSSKKVNKFIPALEQTAKNDSSPKPISDMNTGVKTLTHEATTIAGAPPVESTELLSHEESKARAAEFLRQMLAKK